jgi:hypothetical protein
MTTRQLQIKAYSEWNCSDEKRNRYHTFEYYWWEKYARVYHLPARIRLFGLHIH